MDSLFPFLQGLAPLQHVGLSRRTEYDRQPFRQPFILNLINIFGAVPGPVTLGYSDPI
jgi:hypothetical protein